MCVTLGAQVRLWDVPSGMCLATHSFQKPIASLAFHCDGQHQLLAVASGHKVTLVLCSQAVLCIGRVRLK